MAMIDLGLLLALLWILGCTLIELRLFARPAAAVPGLGWAMIAAFAVRLVPALVLSRGARYEMNVFEQAGELLLAQQNVYHAAVAHPYLPLQIYLLAAAEWLANTLGGTFPFWVKLPTILADTALTWLIFAAVQRMQTPAAALWASWLYVFNPVTILVTAYQGQYDAIPLLLMLGAWYIFAFHRQQTGGLLASALVLGLGVLSKTFPLILLPILLIRLKKIGQWLLVIIAVAAAPVIAITAYEWFFPNSIAPIWTRAVRTGAVPGWWGYSAPLNVFVELTGLGEGFYQLAVQAGRYLSLLAAAVIIVWSRRVSVLAALTLTVLTLFTFMPNLGLQSLSWLIPLGLLMGATELRVYTLAVLFHMLVSYWGIHLTDGLYVLLPTLYASVIIQLSSLTAWGAVIWWWQRALRAQLTNPVAGRP